MQNSKTHLNTQKKEKNRLCIKYVNKGKNKTNKKLKRVTRGSPPSRIPPNFKRFFVRKEKKGKNNSRLTTTIANSLTV